MKFLTNLFKVGAEMSAYLKEQGAMTNFFGDQF